MDRQFDEMGLDELPIGESGVVVSVDGEGAVRSRLRDLGFIEGARLTCMGKSPLGSPRAYLIRGGVIAIRNKDAENITIWREEKTEKDVGENDEILEE